nr:uncharacterized protein CTRU02_02082 [Colletotrichum truncatum]KAF6799211.1 hypothetical protein CTRU02_02082 [Colletotrichum truncatum]
MAQLLAPYNNSMRLGQGFNSYIQQICLDNAVLEDTEENRARLDDILHSSGHFSPPRAPKRGSADSAVAWTEPNYGVAIDSSSDHDVEDAEVKIIEQTQAKDEKCMGSKEKSTRSPESRRWGKSQIVTYNSRFVDKLSDVTEAMNISGSLSIKTGIIGGQANGSYVDSDKFKSSDINVHVQVKVTNQTEDASKRFTIFNKIKPLENKDFAKIYGDTFISGWEEGGEFNAIISMKVADKSKIADIKAEIDAHITLPSAIKPKVSASSGKDKSNIAKYTETTFAVSWSGGGIIKDRGEEWSIPTVIKTAAAFPDLVAETPQRTYAILTKYSALESYHSQMGHHRPLSYENAGIYTNALLDHYMDYKVLWKQISQAIYELEAGRATIEKARPSEDLFKHTDIKNQLTQTDVELLIGRKPVMDSNAHTSAELQPNGEPRTDAVALTAHDLAVTVQTYSGNLAGGITTYEIFNASFAGLIEARKVCRFEMAKLVTEVDLIARYPKLAANSGRDQLFLNPVVFKQLLPIVRVASECSVACQSDPSAALLLGYSPPSEPERQAVPVYKLEESFGAHDVKIQERLHKVRHKSNNYRVQGFAGEITNVRPLAVPKNDLNSLESLDRPTKLEVWYVSGIVQGIQVAYSSNKDLKHGVCDGPSSHIINLDSTGSEAIYEVVIETAVDEMGIPAITQFSVATTRYKVLDTAREPNSQPPYPEAGEDGTYSSGGRGTTSGQAKDSRKGENINTGATMTPKPRRLSNPRTFKWSRPDHNHHWNL